ncbi:MAG TPA: hypothetical protein VLM38_16335 [Blastocatellia bacterium]|nr:hypothetical protein [Blastocatellia bacterium]
MLLSIQFPIGDSRAFLGQKVKLLGRPTWPSASPDNDFVRSFGSIRKRKLGGLSGWIGESALCEASRALRFSKIKNFRESEKGLNIPMRLVFRRFYFDGLAVGKFEVGLTTKVGDTKELTNKQTYELINYYLTLPVVVPGLSDKADSDKTAGVGVKTVLAQAGKPLARFYRSCSMSHPLPAELEDWWVLHGAPLLFLVHAYSERIHIPFFGKAVPRSPNLDCDLFYCEVPYGGRSLRMWVMGLTPNSDYKNVRALRICLLRLHAEHEAMRLVLQNVATNKVDISPRSSESNTLQLYLNEATKRISRLGSEADYLSSGNLAEIARESEDMVNPGERDSLLASLKNIDVRRNIFQKVEDYVRTEIHTKELYMGSKYHIEGGQQGAVGDSAQASNNVFNQWNKSGGNLKGLAEELAKLRAELGKQATNSEQFESAAAIAKAEDAAKKGDGATVFDHLKTAGKWALGIAESIGIPIAIEALKKAIGA